MVFDKDDEEPAISNELAAAMRAALRAELDGWHDRLRVTIREEVSRGVHSPRARFLDPADSIATKSYGMSGPEDIFHDADCTVDAEEFTIQESVKIAKSPSKKSTANNTAHSSAHHFNDIIQSVKSKHKVMRSENTMAFAKWAPKLTSVMQQRDLPDMLIMLDKWYTAWLNVREPERTGILADIESSNVFDAIVCTVIIANCVLMTISADVEIAELGNSPDWLSHWELPFLVFYTFEIVLKLVVHRGYFFLNRLNCLDLILVLLGYVTILADANISGFFLRVVRLLKISRTVRALRVMIHFRELRAFCICLAGSLSNFFWSLVMLAGMFFICSLALVQIVTEHAIDSGGYLTTEMAETFGSVAQTMLSLYQACTIDWSKGYTLISETGVVGAIVYLMFIAFAQFALINIITGIFVESAMSSLSPSSETLAIEKARQEGDHAKELEELCLRVDADHTGKLTVAQFSEGIHRGRIPMLLSLLGMNKHHVLELFSNMSRMAEDDNGQVDIADFVATCMLMKGHATNFDLHLLRAELKALEVAVLENQRAFLKLLKQNSAAVSK